MATAKTAKTAKKTATPSAAKLKGATAIHRAEFAQLKAKLASLRGAGARAYDELWETVATLLDGDAPLYRTGGGYKSLGAFIAAELPGEDERSVRRNVLVATCFTPDDEARHGVDFLEEVARFVQEQSGAAKAPRALDLDRLRIPVRAKDGSVANKKARECSREEVRAARKGLPGAGAKPKASPAEKALRAALKAVDGLHAVTVRVAGEELAFGKVPAGALAAFGRAVAKVKLPKTEG